MTLPENTRKLHSHLLLCPQPLGEGSVTETYHTDCLQFDDTLSHGDQVENGPKRLPLEGPVQCSYNDCLTAVSHLLTELYNIWELQREGGRGGGT